MKKWVILGVVLVVAGGAGIPISAVAIDRLIIPLNIFDEWKNEVIDHPKHKDASRGEILDLERRFIEHVKNREYMQGWTDKDFNRLVVKPVSAITFLSHPEFQHDLETINEYNLIVSKLKKRETILTGVLYVSIGSTGMGIVIFIGCFTCWLIKSKKMSKFVDIVCFCISPTVLATAFLVDVICDDILLLVVSVCIFLLLLGIVRVCWKVADLKNKS